MSVPRTNSVMLFGGIAICLSLAASNVFAIADAVANPHPPIVQGELTSVSGQALAVDAAGNRYVMGQFNQTLDFNPGVGVDEKFGPATPDLSFGFVTRFNADGSYAWTQTLTTAGTVLPEAITLSADGSVIYMSGNFNIDLQIAAAGPKILSAGSFDAFVVALSSATGAPVTTFGQASSGIQTVGGSGNDFGAGIAVNSGSIYITGSFGGDLRIGAAGPQVSAGFESVDAFIAALDATTGAALPAFGLNSSGIQTFGGSSSDSGMGVAAFGTTVFVCGRFSDSNAEIGGGGPTVGTTGAGAFILALDATSGAAKTSFGQNSSGIQVVTGSGQTFLSSIVSTATTVYLTGYFDGTNTAVKGSGEVPTSPSAPTACVVALDAVSGVPLANFGFVGTGIQTFGGAGMSQGYGLALSGTTLYATGVFNDSSAVIGGSEQGQVMVMAFNERNGARAVTTDDVFILALDPATGLGKTAFGNSGVQTYAGTGVDFGFGVALSSTAFYAAGSTTSTNGFVGSFGPFDSTGFGSFLVELDPVSGLLNRAPTALALSNSSIPENSPKNTLVGDLSATDPDAGNTFTFALVAGIGSADNAAFSIAGKSLLTNTTFNFDTQNSYAIRVRVTDQVGAFFEQPFVITITDVMPPPPPPVVIVNTAPTNVTLNNSTLSANSAAGSPVGAFSTVDADKDNVFTYTLVAGEGSDDIASFSVNGALLSSARTFDFNQQNEFTIRVRSTDQGGLSVEKVFIVNLIAVTATGIQNVSNKTDGVDTVVNPDDGVGITVLNSSGGVIQLGIDVNLLGRASFNVNTEWGDVPGRGTNTKGLRPSHQYTKQGIFVATSTVTDPVTGRVLGRMRKTLAISGRETGEGPPSSTGAVGPRSARQTAGEAPSNTITTKLARGRFVFGGRNRDTVTYTGRIKLPAGLDTSKPIAFSIGIGNVIANAVIEPRGSGLAGKGAVLQAGGPLTYLKVSYGVRNSAIAKGGESAILTAVFAASALTKSGFDTEGISIQASTSGGKSATRKIQVAMLLDGVSYESLAPVNFSVSKDSAFGSIQSRN